MDPSKNVHARIAALETELQALKADLPVANESATTDRRGLVKLLAAGAVGAVTGAVALSASPAGAADGAPVVQGVANNATNTTSLVASADSALFLNGAVYGLEVDGGAANALFIASGLSPQARPGDAGALYVDAGGTWWVCVIGSATAATWRSIGGPTAAGQLNLLPAPRRVYDSRPGNAPTPGGDGALAGGGSRPVDLSFGTAGGILGPAVPFAATAALLSRTVTNTLGSGFMAVFSNAVVYPGNSNINWSASAQNIAVTTLTALDSARVCRFQSGGGATDFLVDVIGYYL